MIQIFNIKHIFNKGAIKIIWDVGINEYPCLEQAAVLIFKNWQAFHHTVSWKFTSKTLVYLNFELRSRRGVGDKPMSCKPGVAGSIPGFSQSVG